MSSSSTFTTAADDFVLGRKLVVHVAENGHSFEFECDGTTLVEAIQRSIEDLSGVPIVRQLLLCRNTSLDSQQPLSRYKLPQDDREVFLYNKARLHANSLRPALEDIVVPEAAIPTPLSSMEDAHPLDNAADPALKALISYERQFRYHFQVANAVYGCTQAKFELCKKLLREQLVQERALETALANLDFTFRKLQQRYTEFIRCHSLQRRSLLDLLDHFDQDVERLRSLKLHPRLQSEGRECLLDLVEEDKLRKRADTCSNSHQQFEGKVSRLKMRFGELKRRLEDLYSEMNSAACKDLEHAIEGHKRILDDQRKTMQFLSKDVNTAKKLVDDSSNHQLSGSIRPHDAVSALGRIYDDHEKSHLSNVQNCDHAISKLLDQCKCKKNDMNLLVHVCMQKVKSVQSGIRDKMNELHAFEEVMGHQEQEFEKLMFVNRIGQAYRACLAEIVRRKSSWKLYMGLARYSAEKLATEREAEMARRDKFFRTWSKYIPHDILDSMGLSDSPSQCTVHVAPFDKTLLEIDVADVDRFAPQFLVGSLSLSERSGVPIGCLGTSSDSCNVATFEEDSAHTGERIDFQEYFEDSESIDIGISMMEVENARLKAELASALALICTMSAGIGCDSKDEGQMDDTLKTMKEKTTEALHLKEEYAKHLRSLLNRKQEQCFSYKKRIQELEQGLSDQYLQGQKLSACKDASDSILSAIKTDDSKSDMYAEGDAHILYASTMPMDKVSCASASADPKFYQITGQQSKPGESGDEKMTDILAPLNMQSVNSGHAMDASMQEPPCDENQVGDIDREAKIMAPQLTVTNDSSNLSTVVSLNVLPCETTAEPSMESKDSDSLVVDLQNALAGKLKKLDETENKLKSAREEVNCLRRKLEISQNLLDESQMNCAHLENCLHQAREEVHTKQCAADRRGSEYNALRTSAVKMRSLFERFHHCVAASGVAGFADSLFSLASSVNKGEDDGTAEFQAGIEVLAERVAFLSQHQVELSARCAGAEAAHGYLVKELKEKEELIKSLYTKHQQEKQANKEKVSFKHFRVHEFATFVLNSAGHYEAINRNCSYYFLSGESVALFTEQHPSRPAYIIGQIVHIERRIVRPAISMRSELGDQTEASSSENSKWQSPGSGSASNPYNLPVGCEYFIVTVAMLPDTIH